MFTLADARGRSGGALRTALPLIAIYRVVLQDQVAHNHAWVQLAVSTLTKRVDISRTRGVRNGSRSRERDDGVVRRAIGLLELLAEHRVAPAFSEYPLVWLIGTRHLLQAIPVQIAIG